MTIAELLDQIIERGIAEVKVSYPAGTSKHDGAIVGFESCRGKTGHELVALWQAFEKRAYEGLGTDNAREHNYWYNRYAALQIEWTMNVLSVGLTLAGHPPLAAHLPTMRAAQEYSRIVGVQGAQITS